MSHKLQQCLQTRIKLPADSKHPWSAFQKNDVHLLCERNQTPATPDQNRPKTLPRGPFIGTCLGGPRKAGYYRYLERTSRACVHTSSLAPRHLCHVFVISRLLIRHQMGYFQGFHPHPCQCCVESPFYVLFVLVFYYGVSVVQQMLS